MAKYRITAPDGGTYEITAPDSATEQDVLTFARQKFRPSEPKLDPTKGMSGPDKFLAGVGKGMTDLARGVGQRLGMVDQASIDEAAKLDAPLMRTGAGATGNVVGKVATALPTMAIPGANTMVGATAIGAGMGLAEPTKTGDSVLENVLTGAAGGAVGQAVGGLATRMMRPVQAPANPQRAALAQAAQARGIPLDAADLTGSRPLTVMRDVMANMPLTADRQAALQAAKQQAYNRAISGTYGGADDALTPQALQAARTRIGQQFTDLSARNNLLADNAFLTRLGASVDETNRFATADVARIVNNRVDDLLARVDGNGQIPGNAYRQFDSAIGRQMRTTSNGDLRHALGQIRDAVRDAMDNSISAVDQAAWRQARSEYGNLMTVAPLAARDAGGDVSGRALLAAALRRGSNTAFTGGGELGELGRIGRTFIAEQTPNSGTAQRMFMQRFLENPLNASWQQGVGGISLPVQAAMNSPAGIRYLSQGLVPMTERQRALALALSRSTGAAVPFANREE